MEFAIRLELTIQAMTPPMEAPRSRFAACRLRIDFPFHLSRRFNEIQRKQQREEQQQQAD